MTYIENLKLWWQGWSRFNEIIFKPGWGPDKMNWRLLYALDYLATPLFLAGPVVSLSRYAGDYFGLDGAHFAQAGPPLWGSRRCQPWVRIAVPVAWVALAAWVLV
jgi:hypothetical protein